MSPELQLLCYSAAFVCFLLAVWGPTWGPSNRRRPLNLGWAGAALITLPLLVGALDAV